MSEEDIKFRLSRLTEEEFEVIRELCKEKRSDSDIGHDLGFSESKTRNLRMTALARLDPYGLDDVRPYVVHDPFEEFFRGQQEEAQQPLPFPGQEEETSGGNSDEDDSESVGGGEGEEESGGQQVSGFQDLEPPSTERNERNWRPLLIIIGVVVILVLLVAGGSWVYYRITTNFTDIPEAIADVAEDHSALLPVPDTPTPQPTDTPLPTPTPDPTSTPTITPIPTDTPTPTLTPTPVVVEAVKFDFANGPTEGIDELDDNAVWGGGLLGASNSTWLAIGDPNWTDYKVTAIEPYVRGFDEVTLIGVRGQDKNNLVALRLYENGGGRFAKWVKHEDGRAIDVSNNETVKTGVVSEIIIEVVGNSFTASFPSGEELTYFDTDYESGRVFLFLNPRSTIRGINIDPIEE